MTSLKLKLSHIDRAKYGRRDITKRWDFSSYLVRNDIIIIKKKFIIQKAMLYE